MRPGYLRKNGIPYSANASLEEYLDRFSEPNGDTWLIATIVVTDPQYLAQPYVAHAQFKKLPDASGWDPTAVPGGRSALAEDQGHAPKRFVRGRKARVDHARVVSTTFHRNKMIPQGQQPALNRILPTGKSSP